jgi:hypothetical protein
MGRGREPVAITREQVGHARAWSTTPNSAVESEPVDNHDQTREELISARVVSVESAHVRARVQAPVAYVDHHGAYAGHGVRVGDLVEVPRSMILFASQLVGD